MAKGPGKYDDICTMVRQEAGSEGALILIFNGNQGNGFSVQGSPETYMELPGILRYVATQIETDLQKELN